MSIFANRRSSVIAVAFGGILALASCTSTTTADPATAPTAEPTTRDSAQGTSTLVLEPGEAGGVAQETFTVSVTVSAIDQATRNVTLVSDDGSKASFTASPEIRNFDQMEIGDKVNVTIVERMVIFVRSGGEDPTVTHAAAVATAPKGAKPGVLAAQSFEIIATVTAIDPTLRTAVLQFSDGQTRTVTVRPDVDLSRYKAGDSVVIRVSEALSVVVKKP